MCSFAGRSEHAVLHGAIPLSGNPPYWNGQLGCKASKNPSRGRQSGSCEFQRRITAYPGKDRNRLNLATCTSRPTTHEGISGSASPMRAVSTGQRLSSESSSCVRPRPFGLIYQEPRKRGRPDYTVMQAGHARKYSRTAATMLKYTTFQGRIHVHYFLPVLPLVVCLVPARGDRGGDRAMEPSIRESDSLRIPGQPDFYSGTPLRIQSRMKRHLRLSDQDPNDSSGSHCRGPRRIKGIVRGGCPSTIYNAVPSRLSNPGRFS